MTDIIPPTNGVVQDATHTSLPIPIPNSTTDDASLDALGQPTNAGECGPAAELATEQILASDRIAFLADELLPRRALCCCITAARAQVYELALLCWLHSLPDIEQVTVRCCGPQIHVILYFFETQDVDSAEQRKLWQAIAHVAYEAMPLTPDDTGKTEVYRTIFPTNSRRGAQVVRLSADEILDFRRHMATSPFWVVMQVLYNADTVTPCPMCRQPGTHLSAFDHEGNCDGCGRVSLSDMRALMVYPNADL